MAANNEVGTIQPIREIGDTAKENGVPFHTDAVQAVTKMPLNVNEDNIDLLAMSAHKFHGPKGVGALYVRNGTAIRPITFGGGQERGLRSSTENVAGIVGMGTAISLGIQTVAEDIELVSKMRDSIIERALSSISGIRLNGPRSLRLCNNVHFSFDHVEGESLVLSLDRLGIAVGTGSACSNKSMDPSHVLRALGASNEECRGTLRITLSRMNNADEAEYLLGVLPDVVSDLRRMAGG
jgi:cysteine desulfurase